MGLQILNQPDKIKANIRARKVAEEVFQLCEDESKDIGINETRFWETLAEKCAAKLGKVLINAYREMDTAEAKYFEENTEMPYGKYQGQTIKAMVEQNGEYLAWLGENQFSNNLSRYLRSSYYKSKLNVGEE
jgi:hypothetical protein